VTSFSETTRNRKWPDQASEGLGNLAKLAALANLCAPTFCHGEFTVSSSAVVPDLLLVMQVNRLVWRNKFLMTVSHGVTKYHQHSRDSFELPNLIFFGRGEGELFHRQHCFSVSGSQR